MELLMKIKFVLTLVILAMSFGIFQARPVVLADDGDTICPHTIGYWKNHEEAWPTDITFEPDTVFPYQVEGSELTYLEVLKKSKSSRYDQYACRTRNRICLKCGIWY